MTNIEWTNETWNPLAAFDRETGKRGWMCTKVSPGCTNCYAEKINQRRGNGHLYRVGNVQKIEWQLVGLDKPLRWRRPRMVFVNSMTDLFHENVSRRMIAQVFAVMMATPRHTYQVLTKRPEFMAELLSEPDFWASVHGYFTENWAGMEALAMVGEVGPDNPLLNVWLGTSVEDQERANERIPHLLRTPAAIRFLSCEPLLGPPDLKNPNVDLDNGMTVNAFEFEAGNVHLDPEDRPRIHWVIVGGESGTGSRVCDLDWLRSIVVQCAQAGVAVFVKQLGKRPVGIWGPNPPMCNLTTVGQPGSQLVEYRHKNGVWRLRDNKGGYLDEWPPELRVREFPTLAAAGAADRTMP